MALLLLFAYVFPSAVPSSFQATPLLSFLDESEGFVLLQFEQS